MLINGVTETVKNELKESKGRFLDMLAVTMGASLLGNLLAGKGVVWCSDGFLRPGEWIIRAGEG